METRKCPFRKTTEYQYYIYDDKNNKRGWLRTTMKDAEQAQEYFLDCIGEECMAYEDGGWCLLLNDNRRH